MNALLVRVAADMSPGGGGFNGPIDIATGAFAYIPIPETKPFHNEMATPYSSLKPKISSSPWPLPRQVLRMHMHLDPDFANLTYGDQGQRARRIADQISKNDLLVFYAGLRSTLPQTDLVYAIIGLFVVHEIVLATRVPRARWHENAHTRRKLERGADDIVVRGKKGPSGRLRHGIPIGSYRHPRDGRHKGKSYRVQPELLSIWGGLSIADGFIQRSAYLPAFASADRFYSWFLAQEPEVIAANN